MEKADEIFIGAFWSYQLENEAFKAALKNFIETMTVFSKINILLQEPLLANSPIRSQRFMRLGLNSNVAIDDKYTNANYYLIENFTHMENIEIYNPKSFSLFNDPPWFDGEVIYFDGHHLNEVGAVKYAEYVSLYYKEIKP